MPNRLILLLTAAISFVAGSALSHGATFVGGEGDDSIEGTAVNDVINARGGNDIVNALAGDDFIIGGLGGGVLDGGLGSDVIVSTTLSFGIYGQPMEVAQSGMLTMNGGAGDDLLLLGVSLDPGSSIDCGPGNDVLTFNPSLALGDSRAPEEFGYIRNCEEWNFGPYDGLDISKFPANNVMPNGWYRLSSLPLNDMSNIVVTDANVAGLDRRLTISFPIFFSGRIVDASAVTKTGVIFRPILIGNSGTPTWGGKGSQADDMYYGTLYPDTFVGNGGNDDFDGGDGLDIAVFSGNAADYTVTEVTYNTFTVRDNRPGSPDGTDTIVDVNKLQFADQTVDVVIRGLNIVGDDTNNSLAGTAYSDRLEGLAGIDTLSGNAGNDQLIGGTGADRMTGGTGNDEYAFDNTGDTATEASGGGIDTVQSSVSIAQLPNYVENLTLTGAAAINGKGNWLNNTIRGNAAANILSGAGGSDTFVGGPGYDTFYGNSPALRGTETDTLSYEDATSAVTFNLAVTTAQVTGAAGSDRVPDGSIENLIGGAGGDRLTGSNGANRIEGRGGNDTINGAPGPDVLIGNAGLDVINCGAETVNAADIVTYLSAGDSPAGASRDQIVNFKPGDRINLSAIDANTAAAGNQAFSFNMTTPRANAVWYAVVGSSVLVRGDVNGNTTPDFEILVKGRASLMSTDFVL